VLNNLAGRQLFQWRVDQVLHCIKWGILIFYFQLKW